MQFVKNVIARASESTCDSSRFCLTLRLFCRENISFPTTLPYIGVGICGKIHCPFFIKRIIGISHPYIYTTEVKVKLETKFGLITGGEDITGNLLDRILSRGFAG